MKGNISAWAIKNPIAPLLLFILLMIVGLFSFNSIAINSDPNIEVPFITVTVTQPGAAPAELETQVTTRVEAALTAIQGVKRIQSSVGEGYSSTFIEMQIGTDVEKALDDARSAMTRIRSDLPQDIREPQVARVEIATSPIATYAVESASMAPEELSWYIDSKISREVLSIKGVAQVSRQGGVEREITIELNPARMDALGVTASDISRGLRSTNVNLPSGRAEAEGGEQAIRTLGSAKSLEELGATSISVGGGRYVRLDAVATLRDGAAELRTIARLDDRPITSFAVFPTKGASQLATYKKVEKAIEKLNKDHPNAKISLIFTFTDWTKESYNISMLALIEGALLAIVVVFIFLRDWRATIISAFAIPLSVIPTFYVMQQLGFSLNQVTLLALGLVAGILVDDAIVEIENIVRHIRMGKRPFAAALEAADEIGLAVIATTATIVVVFTPVSFMTGITGQYFREFGLTVAIAVIFSLLVARLLTPMMAAYFLKATPPEKESQTKESFLGFIRLALRNRWKTVFLGGLVVMASFFLVTKIPAAFVPKVDQGSSRFQMQLPPGLTVAEADAKMREVSNIIMDNPATKQVYASMESNLTSADLEVTLKPRNERDYDQMAFEDQIREKLTKVTDARINVRSNFGFSSADLEILLVGEDPILLAKTADNIINEVRKKPWAVDLRSSADQVRPEIHIRPRTDAAAAAGVSVASIADAARLSTVGDFEQNLPKFNAGDRQIPIRVMLDRANRADIESIKALKVPTNTGGSVRLDSVADVEFGGGETVIQRQNRERRISILANLSGIELGAAMAELRQIPAYRDLPPGIRFINSGNSEQLGELFSQFGIAIGLGVFLIFCVLVLLFKDFLQPITILTVLPLSITGAFLALFLLQEPLSLPALIGLLMLMGIVTKNSILLVEFAIEAERAGVSRFEALVSAVDKRARPIIMTTLAMIGGMMPAALATTGEGAFRHGMAVAVIGGLMVSTLLSLIVVPVMYSIVADIDHFLGRHLTKLTTLEKGDVEAGNAELAAREAAAKEAN